jgi:hypothetical protein
VIIGPLVTLKLVVALMLYVWLPVSALTYHFSRRLRRVIEVERMLALLRIEPAYAKAFAPDSLTAYLASVSFVTVIAAIGFALLLFANEIGLPNGEFTTVTLSNVEFPQRGSRIVFAMAFLGVYLSGLQHIYRRYAVNDLSPTLYYGFGIRILTAATIALVIYNAYSALSGSDTSDGGITANIWPALAFLIGIFPQRGFRWLSDRVPMFTAATDATVRPAPLEMIEGLEGHDVLRLEELGIDNCYDLAAADFVPVLLKTPYSARQLVDWILQAKLCVYFGASVKELRHLGIRTIVDLEALTPEELISLPEVTSVTAPVLSRARESVRQSPEMLRLREVGQMLGMFWGRGVEQPQIK